VLLRATEQLVQQQVQVWTQSLAAAEQHWAQAGQRQQTQLAAALEQTLEKTLLTHQGRLAALEEHLDRQTAALHTAGREQQEALARVMDAVVAQTGALAGLQDDGQQLVRLQEALHHNLAALQGTGSFEQAVQALTAAIHLMTARTTGMGGSATNRPGSRPGAAA
jgi:hypothetical protein